MLNASGPGNGRGWVFPGLGGGRWVGKLALRNCLSLASPVSHASSFCIGTGSPLPSADWVKIPGTFRPSTPQSLSTPQPLIPHPHCTFMGLPISLSCSTDTSTGEWDMDLGEEDSLHTHRSYPVLDFQVEIRISCTASICTVGHGCVGPDTYFRFLRDAGMESHLLIHQEMMVGGYSGKGILRWYFSADE